MSHPFSVHPNTYQAGHGVTGMVNRSDIGYFYVHFQMSDIPYAWPILSQSHTLFSRHFAALSSYFSVK